MNIFEKALMLSAGLMTLYPTFTTDFIGIMLVSIVYLIQYKKSKYIISSDEDLDIEPI